MLLTRTLQHLRLDRWSPTEAADARSSSSAGGSGSSSTGGGAMVDGGGLSRRELAVQLLLFLQLLEHWVIADAVKAGEGTAWNCKGDWHTM
jgi:hypothetical protein